MPLSTGLMMRLDFFAWSDAKKQPSGSMAGCGLCMLTRALLQDLESSEKLAEQINELFPEERLYR